jgi:predicted DNA-binding transcriptional regulator AlpA
VSDSRMEANAVEQVRVRVLPDGRMRREDAARYLGLASKTLSNLQLQGKGPKPIRLGHLVFYYKSDLDQYIRDQAVAA